MKTIKEFSQVENILNSVFKENFENGVEPEREVIKNGMVIKHTNKDNCLSIRFDFMDNGDTEFISAVFK